MINEIRKIKLEEYIEEKGYNQKLTQIEQNIQALKDLKQNTNITQLKDDIKKLENQTNNVFLRYFNKKKYTQLMEKLEQKRGLLNKVENSSYFQTLYDDKKRIELDIKNKQETLKRKNLYDFHLDLQGAIKLLEQYHVHPVLTEEDKGLLQVMVPKHESDISSLEGIQKLKDYVLIHKTKYYPKDGRIKTDKEVGVVHPFDLHLDKIGSIQYSFPRNTIHFAVNGEVGSHYGGNWEDCRYAVIIPFPDMPVSQLRCGAVMDTYIEGGLALPKSTIILCPNEEIEEVKIKNPNIQVIGYIGANVTRYADTIIKMMGYNVEVVSEWNWLNKENSDKYYSVFRQTGLDKSTQTRKAVHITPHTYSDEGILEWSLDGLRKLEAVISKLLEKEIYLSKDEILETLPILLNISNKDDIQEKVMNELLLFLNKKGIILSESKIKEFVSAVNSNRGNVARDNFVEYIINQVYKKYSYKSVLAREMISLKTLQDKFDKITGNEKDLSFNEFNDYVMKDFHFISTEDINTKYLPNLSNDKFKFLNEFLSSKGIVISPKNIALIMKIVEKLSSGKETEEDIKKELDIKENLDDFIKLIISSDIYKQCYRDFYDYNQVLKREIDGLKLIEEKYNRLMLYTCKIKEEDELEKIFNEIYKIMQDLHFISTEDINPKYFLNLLDNKFEFLSSKGMEIWPKNKALIREIVEKLSSGKETEEDIKKELNIKESLDDYLRNLFIENICNQLRINFQQYTQEKNRII